MPLVSILSDFGLRDPYVAELKVAILSIHPEAQIIDISHQVERHNIVQGAFLLEMACAFFPGGTVHLAVVDPGVGGSRLPIIIECQNHSLLVGPDNGLLTRAADRLGFMRAYRIENPSFTANSVSPTFEGRDLFAVAVARLLGGARPSACGRRVSSLIRTPINEPRIENGRLKCSVVHIDNFGNVVTNARTNHLRKIGARIGDRVLIRSRRRRVRPWLQRTYTDVRLGDSLVVEGSQGYLEIAVREGDASERLRVKILDDLEIRRSSY